MSTVAGSHAAEVWEREIVPVLHDYIRIPNLSPMFDAQWEEHGHMEQAVQLIVDWCRARHLPGLAVDVHRLPGRTPVVVIEVPAANGGSPDDTVLLYGHLDKQPEMVGWREGLGPWTPVREGDRLYGRGGADDGYSAFASLTAIEAAQAAGLAHSRCVVLIEACEESGSYDLPAHIDALSDRIGDPTLIICLDSGCGDFDRLWVTTSLRGMVGGRLEVSVLRDGVHSGDASGLVPSTFRIARTLLSRIEDEVTGEILLPELHAEVPPRRTEEAAATAAIIGRYSDEFPMLPGVAPMVADATEQLLARTWKPALSVTGADGLPPTSKAGNVLRPTTALQLSIRIPPTVVPEVAAKAVTAALTSDVPYGAHVSFEPDFGPGWDAPPFAPWLWSSLQRSSQQLFGAPVAALGEGGSIPFMGMLGARYPRAQFCITGVLTPDSGAHGPNEYLHVPTAMKLTGVIAHLLADHATR